MHFKEASQTERVEVYDKLTEIFRALPEPNEDLIKALQYHNFNYKESLKSKTNFRIDKTTEALERAEALDESFPKNTKPSEKAPCTKVYLLVKELLHYGQKLDIMVLKYNL